MTYTIKYGDSTPDKKIVASEFGLGPYSLMHKYVSIGHFNIEIRASNLVSTAVPTKKTVIVEKLLGVLQVKWILPRRLNYNTSITFIAVGEEITVEMSLKYGTNPLYRVYFGEQKLDLNSKSSVTFKYSKTGTYNITAQGYNHVSKLSQSYPIPIIVQDDEKIAGLKLRLSPTHFGYTTSMILAMDSGTAFVCYWSFGDGATALRDVTNFNVTMYHKYGSLGFYNVHVSCENKHGNSSVQNTAVVSIPIIEPNISANHKPLLTNSTQIFTITVENGSDVTYDINFGDGNSLQTHLANTTARDRDFQVSHTYKQVGVYYATVYARNQLGSKRVTMHYPIIVQNPITPQIISLNNKSPVKIPDGKLLFFLELLIQLNTPTNVTCFWDFGDNVTKQVQTSIPKKNHYMYGQEGRYVINVLCKNAVSIARINSSVIIYRMAVPRMSINSPDKIIDNSSKKMYLSSGANVTFCVTTQPYDMIYIWSGLDRLDHITTNDSCIDHVVYEPRVYEINVAVNNSLETMAAKGHFEVQTKTRGLLIHSNGSSLIREYATLFWTAAVFGTDACYSLNFNDSSSDVIYGPAMCSKQGTYLVDALKPIMVKHRYMKEGVYEVTVRGENMVSVVTSNTKVTVVKPVCKISNVTILWNNKMIAIFRFLRSQSFEIKVLYHQQCYFGEGVDVSWKLFKNSSGIETVVRLNSLQTRRVEYLSFSALDLPCGSYRVEVVVRLTGSALQGIYGDVLNSKSAKIDITPSPLQARIKGGSFIMVDPDVSFNLDGGDSADPDEYISHLNLNYRWYCKRKLKHNNEFIGCYSSNRNHLEPIGYDRLLFTIAKELIRNTSYYFTLEVHKASRTARAHQTVFVSFGLPPKMKIM